MAPVPVRLFSCLLLCAAAGWAATPPRIVLVGDSTVHDDGGWGPGFKLGFRPGTVVVLNHARNGRSSKSFRDEGLWAPSLADKPDYVILQFGHNDCPGKGPQRETVPATTYRANMIRYVEETRAAGAQPVLATSIVRRVFRPDGSFKPDALVPYAEEIRKIAAEMKVPLIDLYALTMAQASALGPVRTAYIGRTALDGTLDTTHLGPRGQREIGLMAAREFARLFPSMQPNLSGWLLPPVHMKVGPGADGQFSSIMNALGRAVVADGQRLILDLEPGTYRERVLITPDHPRVTLRGRDAASTVITYDLSAKAAGGTSVCASVQVFAPEFEAENVTFENSFGSGSQAVAILIHSDRAVFRNCRFLGWQDTLYAASGRQYFKDCYIEGHVDFIFGNATAVFDGCTIHSKGSGYITAQSRLAPEQTTGYIFSNSKFTAAIDAKVFLGRPWRPYSRVVYLNCELGTHIVPEGWNNWNNAANEKTAWYGEFQSKGPGAPQPGRRAAWAHQLTETEAAEFDPVKFLAGADNWTPALDPL
ncbi:MAG: pectin esterase [Acidobacteria bacterium]|nr:pectin esterase [Acidobacteriota bacterium]